MRQQDDVSLQHISPKLLLHFKETMEHPPANATFSMNCSMLSLVTIVICGLFLCHVSAVQNAASPEQSTIIIDDSDDWDAYSTNDLEQHAILAAHLDKKPNEELNSLLDKQPEDLPITTTTTTPTPEPSQQQQATEQPAASSGSTVTESQPSAQGEASNANTAAPADTESRDSSDTPAHSDHDTPVTDAPEPAVHPGIDEESVAESTPFTSDVDSQDETTTTITTTIGSTDSPSEDGNSDDEDDTQEPEKPVDSSAQNLAVQTAPLNAEVMVNTTMSESSAIKDGEQPANDAVYQTVYTSIESIPSDASIQNETGMAQLDPTETPVITQTSGGSPISESEDSLSAPGGQKATESPEVNSKLNDSTSEVAASAASSKPASSVDASAKPPTRRRTRVRSSDSDVDKTDPPSASLDTTLVAEPSKEETTQSPANDDKDYSTNESTQQARVEKANPGRLSKYNDYMEEDEYDGGSFPGITITSNMIILTITLGFVVLAIVYQFKRSNDTTPLVVPQAKSAPQEPAPPRPRNNSIKLREEEMRLMEENRILRRKLRLAPLKEILDNLTVKQYELENSKREAQLDKLTELKRLTAESKKLQEKDQAVKYATIKKIRTLFNTELRPKNVEWREEEHLIDRVAGAMRFIDWKERYNTSLNAALVAEVGLEVLEELIERFKKVSTKMKEDYDTLQDELEKEKSRERELEEETKHLRAQLKAFSRN